MSIKKKQEEGFPFGSVVKNPPANAGDTGSVPGPGRPYMPLSNLSPCATTTEPALRSPGTPTTELALWSLGTPTTEPTRPRAHAPQQEEPPQ